MKDIKKQWSRYLLMTILWLIIIGGLSAQDSMPVQKKMHILLEPYLMFPNMSGTSGLGELPDADVKADPGDIFSHLQIGAMLYAEIYNQRWAFSSDFIYMDLGQDVTSGTVIQSGNIDMKQLGWELAALRKIKPWLEAGLAAQLNSIKCGLDLTVQGSGRSKSLTETWVDPSIVARIKIPKNKWLFQLRANIGGFGIGSDFYWQLQAYAGYRVSKLLSLSAGYRVIDADYEKGDGNDRFLYDMATYGPVLRFGFNF